MSRKGMGAVRETLSVAVILLLLAVYAIAAAPVLKVVIGATAARPVAAGTAAATDH